MEHRGAILLPLCQENSFRRHPIASIRYILYTGKEPLRGAALFHFLFYIVFLYITALGGKDYV